MGTWEEAKLWISGDASGQLRQLCDIRSNSTPSGPLLLTTPLIFLVPSTHWCWQKSRKTRSKTSFAEFRMHCAGSIYSERDGSRMNLETMTPFSPRSNSSAPHVAFHCCRLNDFKARICWLMELTHWHADYWTAFSFMHLMQWCGKCSTHLRALMGCNPVNQHIFTSFNKGISLSFCKMGIPWWLLWTLVTGYLINIL